MERPPSGSGRCQGRHRPAATYSTPPYSTPTVRRPYKLAIGAKLSSMSAVLLVRFVL